jgi:hypothetical protein
MRASQKTFFDLKNYPPMERLINSDSTVREMEAVLSP